MTEPEHDKEPPLCYYCGKPIDGKTMFYGTVWAMHVYPKTEYNAMHIACLIAAVKRAEEIMKETNK